MRFSARLFLSSLLFVICYLLFVISPVSAQTQSSPSSQRITSPNPYLNPNTNPDVPKNLHTWTQNVMIEVMSALTCQLAGIDPTSSNQQCLGVDQKTGKIGFVPSASSGQAGGGGAIGVMSHMISSLYTFPIHTGDYVGYLAQNFGIAKHAYAQGTGFEGLKPLIGIWSAFRNIVYLIFVIVFVLIGLAIMFRVKIDPRTVMTIQNQIPKIIIGIVLVTFSYAIAGFLIDVMYVSNYLIANIIAQADPKLAADISTKIAQSSTPLQAANITFGIGSTIGSVGGTAGEFVGKIFDNTYGKIVVGVLFGVLGKVVGSALPNLLQGLSGIVPGAGTLAGIVLTKLFDITASGWFSWIFSGVSAGAGYAFAPQIGAVIGTFITWLIVTIALLWALFRLWFVLIFAYIYILIDVVLAPFWIAGGLIPGNPINFTGWLRHIFAKIAVFPTTIILFLLGTVFKDAFGTANTTGQFVPPLITNPTDTSAIGAVIGLGIILLTPNVLKMTDRAFNAPKIDLSGVARALGVGVGVPFSAGKAGVGGILAGQEYIPGAGGQFKQRGAGGAFLGRLFGR